MPIPSAQSVARVLLLAALVLIQNPAANAILAEVTVPELVQMADHIVEAEVLSTSSNWSDDRDQIITTVQLRNRKSHAGSLSDSSFVTVILPGGTVGDIAMEVEHTPEFKVGESVIVFLTDIGGSRFRVSGWEAGKFTVENTRVRENGLTSAQFLKQIESAVSKAGQK